MACSSCGESGHNIRTCKNKTTNRSKSLPASISSPKGVSTSVPSRGYHATNGKGKTLNSDKPMEKVTTTGRDEVSGKKGQDKHKAGLFVKFDPVQLRMHDSPYDEQFKLNNTLALALPKQRFPQESSITPTAGHSILQKKTKSLARQEDKPMQPKKPPIPATNLHGIRVVGDRSRCPLLMAKAPLPGPSWLTPKAQLRLWEGPTPADGPGHIYIYYIKNPKTEEDMSIFKIGMSSGLPARRIEQQKARNKEEYVAYFTEETPYRYLTEKTIHVHLESCNRRRDFGDGKTEWFNGSKDHFKDIVKNVIKEVTFMDVNGQFQRKVSKEDARSIIDDILTLALIGGRSEVCGTRRQILRSSRISTLIPG